MTTIIMPFIINGNVVLHVETARRGQYLKRTKVLKLYADRRAGKDAWSIYNEIKKQTGDEFGNRVLCSPYDGYATLCFRW